MSEPETIEVPVTRTARVALIGQAFAVNHLRVGIGRFYLSGVDARTVIGPLCKFVVRSQPSAGYPFRSGIGIVQRVDPDGILADTSAIQAFCDGDFVYLVED